MAYTMGYKNDISIKVDAKCGWNTSKSTGGWYTYHYKMK